MGHEEEIFDLVDENDRVLSQTTRAAVHGNPSLIHRVAHVLVFNSLDELYLQKRSSSKDVQPGKWDTSVGGHVNSGETYEQAAIREMREELGISGVTHEAQTQATQLHFMQMHFMQMHFMHKYLHRNEYESEYVSTFLVRWEGEIRPDPVEIEEGRFWPIESIRAAAGSGQFTPNFLDEFNRYLTWIESDPAPAL